MRIPISSMSPRRRTATAWLGAVMGVAMIAAFSQSVNASDAEFSAVFQQYSPPLTNAIKEFSRLFFAWKEPADTPWLQTRAAEIGDQVTRFKQAVERVEPSADFGVTSERGRRGKTLLLNALTEYWRASIMFVDAVEPLYNNNRGEATNRMNMATGQAVGAARMMVEAQRALGI